MVAQGLQLAIKNDLAEIAGVTEAIHAFSLRSGLPHEVDNSLQLVAEELLSNIILYGCAADGPHTITMELQASIDEVCVLVRDDGIPFNILEQPIPNRPASLAEAAVGGLGIHLVRSVMDEITYRHEDGWNELLLKKRLKSR
jgi:anti-sigma regulatory factor (Ser/Thr protein kinase)